MVVSRDGAAKRRRCHKA